MRFGLKPLRAASTFTIFGTALATVLISAPAQASNSAADTGHSVTMRSNVTAMVHSVPSAPSARGVGAITGVVDGAGGKPLTGACVVANGTGASGQDDSVLAVTTSDGRYSLTGLPAGSYTLRYSACAAGAAWPGSPAKVSIAAGQVRELATVTLRPMIPSAPAVPPAIARLKSTSAVPGLNPQAVAANAGGQASGGTGAIAGTVTGGGKPILNVCVVAFGAGH